jgi:hypothetical protein
MGFHGYMDFSGGKNRRQVCRRRVPNATLKASSIRLSGRFTGTKVAFQGAADAAASAKKFPRKEGNRLEVVTNGD